MPNSSSKRISFPIKGQEERLLAVVRAATLGTPETCGVHARNPFRCRNIQFAAAGAADRC